MKFTDSQWSSIANGLRAAAQMYDADAETMAATPGHDRLAEQFKRQSAEARELATQIDERE